ncbi:LysE family translocator [Williamsia sterculiae]|uniref:Threonine/homoserine/homoserine lactone efflux protein n=1 Tax=Williamsia sterculiae TaxID=1344003 RepID=A0A1N7DMZ0_9NOCA|nr:LysE family translocator [Williamsia sterculiae]SIR77075.1 Threonine/homoserine/homoserine lactone efflux protein [Williamsia sterculiae]
MDWGTYGAFVAFVSIIILIPGPDVAVTIKNTLVGGRRQGAAAIVGIAIASLVQSTAAATGLSVLVTRAEPVFLAIKWVGAAYLCYLAFQALRSAWRGDVATSSDAAGGRPSVMTGMRQGFLCNITNPKIIAFYLAVLPQFLGSDPTPAGAALYAVSLPVFGSLYLMVLVTGVDRARAVFARRRVRRVMDSITGIALLGFGARLVAE